MGRLVEKFVVGQVVAIERKINPRLFVARSWSASDDPPKVDTRAGGENTHTAQTALLFLHTTFLLEFKANCESRL